MAGTEVLTGKMLDVANRLEEIGREYKNSVDKINTAGAELDQMWNGEAGNKFSAVIARDRDRFDALSKMLAEYADTLRREVEIYARAENDVRDVFNSRRIR